MNRHGIVEIPFAGAHLNRNRETLQHFIDTWSDQVAPNHFLFVAEADQFHRGRNLVPANRVEHRAKTSLVNPYPFTILGARLGLGEADGSDRRVTENHCRD